MAYKFNDQNRKKIASSETIIVSSWKRINRLKVFLEQNPADRSLFCF
jgi:hypothetical protein